VPTTRTARPLSATLSTPARKLPKVNHPQRTLTSPVPRRRTLLWIDDYEPGLLVYKAVFETFGFRVLTATKGSQGLKMVGSNRIDAVVTDFEMPEMDGGIIAASIKNTHPRLPVIMFSGSCGVPDRVKHWVDAFCYKTGPRERLLAAIEGTLSNQSPTVQPPDPATPS
jgi:DNA-binding NtrC family response regulator